MTAGSSRTSFGVPSESVLKKNLTQHDKELLPLRMPERCKKETRGQGQWVHSVAVVHIEKSPEIECFKGRLNHLRRKVDFSLMTPKRGSGTGPYGVG